MHGEDRSVPQTQTLTRTVTDPDTALSWSAAPVGALHLRGGWEAPVTGARGGRATPRLTA